MLFSTSGIVGVSTSWCRFFSSVERRLADKLSLEASDVDSGELRSMDDAMSVGECNSKYSLAAKQLLHSPVLSVSGEQVL